MSQVRRGVGGVFLSKNCSHLSLWVDKCLDALIKATSCEIGTINCNTSTDKLEKVLNDSGK